MDGDDLIERHVDMFAGVGSILWALGASTIVPGFAAICSPEMAAVFGVGALVRWYRKMRKRRSSTSAKDA